MASRLGRVDPSTGVMKEFPLPGDAGPHGLVEDADGNVWYTGINENYIGKLDLNTGTVTKYPIPEAEVVPEGARGPQVNSQGVPWYVDFRGNRVGSVDPETMEITEYELPDPDARPRRLALTPDDVVWYTESGIRDDTLVRFDTETEEFQTWLIPSGGSSVRNMMATADGNLVLACSGVNRVALVEVKNE